MSPGDTRSSRSDKGRHRDSGDAGPQYVYGRNPVIEALGGARQMIRLLVAEGQGGDELQRSLEAAMTGRPRLPVERISAAELSELLQTGDHQGVAAEVGPYPYCDIDELMSEHSLLVALDEIQDPHNLGAIIRTATAAGAGIVIPRHRAAEITAAVVKVSAGVTERAAVAQVRNLADFLVQIKEVGFWVYGAAGGAAAPYTEQDYSYPTCFVVGSEGEGLGRRVASMCDVMVGIPLLGGVESLNVSVSAGILLFEVLRQREVAGAPGWGACAGGSAAGV